MKFANNAMETFIESSKTVATEHESFYVQAQGHSKEVFKVTMPYRDQFHVKYTPAALLENDKQYSLQFPNTGEGRRTLAVLASGLLDQYSEVDITFGAIVNGEKQEHASWENAFFKRTSQEYHTNTLVSIFDILAKSSKK
mmetsp:Transcript_28490/g.80239  ORF Transcript_28490/g.80239 Transcript_28490/m.80239 type:complete len:140 (-) Transcript_28490:1351-1770(-)